MGDICVSDISVSGEAATTRATADPPMVCKLHCQGHTNESRRPQDAQMRAGATMAATATADPPIDCNQLSTRSIQSVLGD